jgi:hypothetical protein
MSQLSGSTQVGGQPLFSSSATQNHVLGELMFSPDGRAFRYCLAGATALVPGKLQQAAAEDTSNLQNLTVSVSSVGATTVTTTSTVTLTANQAAGGILSITSATTGAGYSYRIKSHPAATAAVVTFTLEDPIITATTGTVKVDITTSPYSKVVVNPTTATSAPVGVAIYPITDAQYGWIQVKGACPVLVDDQTVVVGTNVAASNQAAGAIEPHTGVQALVGTALTGGATTDYVQVLLNLA